MDTSAQPRRGRPRSRPSGDDRRRAILATAERLLAERAPEAIAIDDLARGAGISRPSFYFHFPSKDEVFLALLDRVVADGDEKFQHLTIGQDSEPVEVFRRSIQICVDLFTTHRDVIAVAAGATSGELHELWMSSLDRWISSVTEKVDAERREGGASRAVPARHLATALILLNERVLVGGHGRPVIPRPAVTDVLVHIWLTSIYGDAPG